MLLLAQLLACNRGKGSTLGDSAPADSAADTAPGIPTCALAHPWAMDSAAHVGEAAALASPNVARFTLLDGNVVSGARTADQEGDACPTWTESADRTAVTVAGDCDTGWGSTYGGTATFTDVDGTYSSVYDHFHFLDGLNAYGYDVDGGWVDDGAGDFSFALTATLLGDWGVTGLADATVTWSTAFHGSADTVEGYADILAQPTDTAVGDLCVLSAGYSYDPACPTELDEVVTLQGDTVATLTWDGSTACDGCAEVTIGRVDAGSYCPG